MDGKVGQKPTDSCRSAELVPADLECSKAHSWRNGGSDGSRGYPVQRRKVPASRMGENLRFPLSGRTMPTASSLPAGPTQRCRRDPMALVIVTTSVRASYPVPVHGRGPIRVGSEPLSWPALRFGRTGGAYGVRYAARRRQAQGGAPQRGRATSVQAETKAEKGERNPSGVA
jgi:hypothetical protein